MHDYEDWINNANLQIVNNRKQMASHFWKEYNNIKILNEQILQDDKISFIDCKKVRVSQGVVKKIEVDLIIAAMTSGITSIDELTKVKKIYQLYKDASQQSNAGLIAFGYYQESDELDKITRFTNLYEIA